MILPDFDVYEPTSLSDACELLALHQPAVRLLAGGTDVLVNMKKRSMFDVHPPPRCGEHFAGAPHPWAGTDSARVLISLARIPGLAGVTELEDGSVAVGPMTTMSGVASSELLRQRYTALCEGAGAVGAPAIRNRATLAGNLCHARPAADTAPPCIALDARLDVLSPTDQRTVLAGDFILSPGRCALGADEVVSAVVLPPAAPHAGSAYLKQITRATMEISVVGAAVSLVLDGVDGPVATARIALGAVGPTPLRAPAAESALIGQPITPTTLAAVGAAARDDARPIDDHRGSADYRLEMVEVLVRRAASLAAARAKGGDRA